MALVLAVHVVASPALADDVQKFAGFACSFEQTGLTCSNEPGRGFSDLRNI